MKINHVLLGEISSYKAIVIAKFIKQNYPGICVHTYDFRKYTSSIKTKYSDKHHVLTKRDDYEYLKAISKIIKKQNIDYFFPVHSDYIGLILENKQLFNESLSYLGNFDSYQKLHNKQNLLQIASNLGVRIPKRYNSFQEAKIPFIGKPKEGSSAEGVVYIFSEAEKKQYSSQQFGNYIFQEYVEGKGCGYSVYVENGKIKSGYGHIRLAEFPVSGGSSVYRASFYKEEMQEVAEKILEEIPWTGFAMFEFKLTPEGELVVIEVNPRIWGSINQGLQNGINYFEPIFWKSDRVILKNNNIKTFLSPQVYLAFLLYILKGNLKPFIGFIKNIRNNKPDISFWNDPKGWFSVILRKIL